MKKITVLFTMLSVCFMFVICQASTADEFALGGVTLGMSKDDVTNIWIFLPEETVCPGWRKPPVRTTETAN